jgi:segregation and condensation protein B
METLAILAYRQPVTRPEVDFIRGVNSDYAIRKLLELGLADVKGRSDSLGRPLLYGTTTRFLEQFGLSNLDDLPTLREIEELLDEPHFDEERAQLLALKGDGASINGEEPPEITPNGSEAPGDSEDS